MSEIHGTRKISSTPFGRRCRAASTPGVDAGEDIGASVAVFIDGEPGYRHLGRLRRQRPVPVRGIVTRSRTRYPRPRR